MEDLVSQNQLILYVLLTRSNEHQHIVFKIWMTLYSDASTSWYSLEKGLFEAEYLKNLISLSNQQPKAKYFPLCVTAVSMYSYS